MTLHDSLAIYTPLLTRDIANESAQHPPVSDLGPYSPRPRALPASKAAATMPETDDRPVTKTIPLRIRTAADWVKGTYTLYRGNRTREQKKRFNLMFYGQETRKSRASRHHHDTVAHPSTT
jgi:hypothetical protein